MSQTKKAPNPMYLSIKGFIEASFSDWEGRISAVVFLGGCNFRCPFCHNPDLVTSYERLRDISWEKVLKVLRSLKGWVDGVCITGGEPTLAKGLIPLLEDIRSLGYLVKLYTNGSRPKAVANLLGQGLVHFVSMDVKAPLREEPYQRCCGVRPPLKAIAETISILAQDVERCEFRTTLVPGLLNPGDVLEIASMLPKGASYILQGFRPGTTLDPSVSQLKPYPQELIEVLQKEVNERLRPDKEGKGLQMIGLREHIKWLYPGESVGGFALNDSSIPGEARWITRHVDNSLGIQEA